MITDGIKYLLPTNYNYLHIYQYPGGVYSLLFISLTSSVHGNTSNSNMTELRLVPPSFN